MWRVAGALLYLVYGVVARRERYGLSACVEFLLAVEWRYALYGLVEIECYCLGIVNASVYEHNVFVFAVNELRNEYPLSVALYALEFRGHLCERFRAWVCCRLCG